MEGSVSILVPAGSWPGRWKPWVTAALDLVFPPLCPVCRELLGDGRRDPLCGTCWGRLSRIGPPWCRCCGVPLTIDGQCGTCRSRPPRFAYARAAARYGDVVREAIHAFKFAGRRSLADPLGDLLADLGLSALPGPRLDASSSIGKSPWPRAPWLAAPPRRRRLTWMPRREDGMSAAPSSSSTPRRSWAAT